MNEIKKQKQTSKTKEPNKQKQNKTLNPFLKIISAKCYMLCNCFLMLVLQFKLFLSQLTKVRYFVFLFQMLLQRKLAVDLCHGNGQLKQFVRCVCVHATSSDIRPEHMHNTGEVAKPFSEMPGPRGLYNIPFLGIALQFKPFSKLKVFKSLCKFII